MTQVLTTMISFPRPPIRPVHIKHLCCIITVHFHQTQTSPIQTLNPFTWNTLLTSHSQAHNPNAIIATFKLMLQKGAKPNGITFSLVTKAFSNLRELNSLMTTHGQLLRRGFCCDVFTLNTLLHAYVGFGSVDIARRLFDEMPERDLVAWTVLMNGCVRDGRAKEAVEMFFAMVGEDVRPDGMALVAAFNACARLGNLALARKLENMTCGKVAFYDLHVVNSLIDMYSKCGSIEDARKVFDSVVDKDVVTWNCMMSGYAISGDMLAARSFFNSIPKKNDVSWSVLVNGYVRNDEFAEALSVFKRMQALKVVPNNAALTCAFSACAHLGALELGQHVHSSLDENKIQNDVVLSTALVDMYAKCGRLDVSCALFNRIQKRNLISWNVMLIAMAMHGNALGCFGLFCKLLKDGLKPNSETFLAMLSGCAHAGLPEEAIDCFRMMKTVHGVPVQVEHCSCMVQVIGQEGLLDQAYDFIRSCSVTPDVALWGALLSACNVHGDVELGEVAARRMLELDPLHTGAYIQLSSLYAKANMWQEVLNVRTEMKEKGMQNRPGWSSFEVDGSVHEFLAGDDSHPMITEILMLLNTMDIDMNPTLLPVRLSDREIDCLLT